MERGMRRDGERMRRDGEMEKEDEERWRGG